MEFEDHQIDELHRLLQKANVTDDHISRGVRLTNSGEQKIADRFGIAIDDVPRMLTALSKKLSSIHEDAPRMLTALSKKLSSIHEDAPRFTYESDYLGNLTLRDSKTGESRFIQGDQAFQLSDKLAADPRNEQELIASFFNTRVLNESDDETDIVSDKGTFNFPYKGKFATAVYGLDAGGKFICEVISLRNSEDQEIELSDDEKNQLHEIAMNWIEKV